MNILLGKFIQRANLDTIAYLFNRDEVDDFLEDPSIEIKSMVLQDCDILRVAYKKAEKLSRLPINTQHFIGGHVTALARCAMYKHMMEILISDSSAQLLYTGIILRKFI